MHRVDGGMQQPDLFEESTTRSLLDQLLEESRLYKSSTDYKDLLDFVVRLRNFAPFNAMLLQVQKPGLTYAASARDWRERFERYPKEEARPLLILWPFGPVALVYDVQDTDGKPMPEDVASFVAYGAIGKTALLEFESILKKKIIELYWIDAGDGRAGSIEVVQRPKDAKGASRYRIQINRNHTPAVKFATLAHELAHLTLGHLGPDKNLRVPARSGLQHVQRELEAESVAYIVCQRNGVVPKSQSYLTDYVSTSTTVNDLDVYQVMRAAGQIETMLGLAAHARFDRPPLLQAKQAGDGTAEATGSLFSV